MPKKKKKNRPKEVDLEGEFEPSLLNSGVYLIQLSMQVSTFAINYQVEISAIVWSDEIMHI